jgi:SAM-dependent methyltransferase
MTSTATKAQRIGRALYWRVGPPFGGPSYVRSQFARPRGPLGHLAGLVMSRRSSNRDRNRWMVDLLDLEPRHRVLELGPGPGVALAAALDRVTDGLVVGLDHSTTMLCQAARRNPVARAEGRLRLLEGSAENVPAELGSFDRIYAMNVWQFWTDQEWVIARLVERLVPGGLLALGLQPRTPGATAGDTDAAGLCLVDQLTAAGLVDVRRFDLPLQPTPVTCVLGARPPA